jgi:hypothetical protein
MLSYTYIAYPVTHTKIAISLELRFHVQTIRRHILYDSNLCGQLWDTPGCNLFAPYTLPVYRLTQSPAPKLEGLSLYVNWTLGKTARRREVIRQLILTCPWIHVTNYIKWPWLCGMNNTSQGPPFPYHYALIYKHSMSPAYHLLNKIMLVVVLNIFVLFCVLWRCGTWTF